MGSPKILNLRKQNFDTAITYCYFLSSQAFAKFQIEKLKKQIEEAHKLNYKILKIFFGPRFVSFTNRTTPYRINDEKLDPLYSLMEDYHFRSSSTLLIRTFGMQTSILTEPNMGRKQRELLS